MPQFSRRDIERVAKATVDVERRLRNPDTQRARWRGSPGLRLVVTCKDPTTDTYPAEVDSPNTYWAKWAKGTYTKEQGNQSPSFTAHPDEAAVLIHDDGDYLEEGSDVWIGYNNERWWVVGPRCCDESCIYHTDSFGCSGSGTETDLGPNYTEAAGDWHKDCDTDKLVTADSDGLLVCNVLNPEGNTAVIPTATLEGKAEGDQLRILVDYVDQDNYWFGEVEWGPVGGTGILRLCQRSGGTNTTKGRTILEPATVGNSVDLSVCIGDGTVTAGCVWVGDYARLSADATETTSKTGLATGNVNPASEVTFDDFSLSRHEVDQEDCPDCDPTCGYFWDDAGRSNSLDVGPDLIEVAGAWTIDNFDIVTANANAECRIVCDEPEGNDAMSASSSAALSAVGDEWYLVAGDAYLKIKQSNATTLEVKLFGGAGQLGATKFTPRNVSVTQVARICAGDGAVQGHVGNAQWEEAAAVAGSSVSIKTGTLTGVETRFSNISAMRHSSVMEDCFRCLPAIECPNCVDNLAPRALKIVVPAFDNDLSPHCADFAGTLYLDQWPPGPGQPGCIYSLEIDNPSQCVQPTMTWQAFFGYDGANYYLIIQCMTVGTYAYWKKVFPTKPNCRELVDVEVPWSSSALYLIWFGPCTGYGYICDFEKPLHVTSLTW